MNKMKRLRSSTLAARLSTRQRAQSDEKAEDSQTSSSSSDSEDEGNELEAEWIGNSFENEKSSLSYDKVRVNDEIYSIGDSVYVEVEEWSTSQPAVLTNLWEDEDGNMLARGNWYYFPNELLKVKSFGRKALAGELFEARYGDDFPVFALRGRFKVTSDPDEASTGRFKLCRFIYDPDTKTIFPRRDKTGLVTSTDDDDAEEDEAETSLDEFSKARQALALSAIPEDIPCRNEEKEVIHNFIANAIRNGGSSSALYISGLPGTGKTATVHEVIGSIRKQQRRKQIPSFHFVEINGLRLSSPDEAYSILAAGILPNGPTLSAARAAQALDSYFSKSDPKREVTVVLVDEIDQLLTKKQQLLYNLFEWPQRSQARLVVVGVSNTMNFPELLLPRIQSRLGKERVMFLPYTREQIETIVKQRLMDVSVFSKDAIGFAARKVASVSGDVRRALQLCRRAIAVAGRNGCTTVSIDHVNAAVREIDSRAHCQLIASLSVIQKLFLICVHKQITSTMGDFALFQDTYRRLINSCKTDAVLNRLASSPMVSRDSFFRLCCKLVDLGLLRGDWGAVKYAEGPALTLAFDYDDIRIALQSDPQIAPFL